MRLLEADLAVEELSQSYRRRGIRRALNFLLPDRLYAYLRGCGLLGSDLPLASITLKVRSLYLETMASSSFLSAFHYMLFSREFSRENQAILAARARHLDDIVSGRGNIFLLRRNVHRLEKGLTMKPPRDLFGLDKIGETVDAYRSCLERAGSVEGLASTLHWAYSILNCYFDRVSGHEIVDRAASIFRSLEPPMFLEEAEDLPVPFRRREPSNIPTIEQLEDLARFRRSVRWFTTKPVQRSHIDRAISVALQSPSACNRQPFRYEVFDRHDLVQTVGAIPKGTPGWLHQIPCFIVIIGRFDAFRHERDRHVPYIDSSLSAMSLIWALEVQGLSSCCVNFPDFKDTTLRMTRTLNLHPSERAIMCLAVGHPDPDALVAYSQKLPLETMRRFNRLEAAKECP